jgi:L-alanine-DL-glutamate epimerase-like enolase superfamily enzyme
VHKLVGGAVRDKVRVYLNQWRAGYTSTGDLIEKAKAAVARGQRRSNGILSARLTSFSIRS